MALPRPVTRVWSVLNPINHDLNNPTPQSSFVAFFHNYPRFGRGRTIDFTPSYFLTLFLTALPWLVVALACLVFGILVNVCYGGVRRRKLKRDAALLASAGNSASLKRSVTSSTSSSDGGDATIGRITSSVLLFNAAAVLLGVAFVANYHFESGALATITVAESAALDLAADALAVFSILDRLFTRVLNTNDPSLRRIVTAASGERYNLVSGRNIVRSSIRRFRVTARNIREIVAHLRLYGIIAFWLVVAVYILLFIGVMLLFSTAFEKRSSQKFAMSIYLLPFFLSWLAVAIITPSSVLAGDMCVALGDFQKIVLVQSRVLSPSTLSSINVTENLFVRYNVQCPAEIVRGVPLAGFADALALILTPNFAQGTFPLIYPDGTPAQHEQLRGWLLQAIKRAIDCGLVSKLAARLNYAFCQHRGPVMALFSAWVVLILLAFTLTVAYVLTQFTKFEASRFLNPYFADDDADSSGYESFSGIYDSHIAIESAAESALSPPPNPSALPAPPPVLPAPPPVLPAADPASRMPHDALNPVHPPTAAPAPPLPRLPTVPAAPPSPPPPKAPSGPPPPPPPPRMPATRAAAPPPPPPAPPAPRPTGYAAPPPPPPLPPPPVRR